MSIRIDGTNTAANPGITGADADTGLQFGTDEVSIVTGGTDRVKVDSSGRLGVGTTSPAATTHCAGSFFSTSRSVPSSGVGPELCYDTGDAKSLLLSFNRTSSVYVPISIGGSQIEFATGGTERMRINSEGQFKTLTTSTNGHSIVTTQGASSSINLFLGIRSATNVNDGTAVYIVYSNGTYATLSDETQKKNIESTRSGYLEDLKQLRVVKYNWKDQDDSEPKELGLIAQEVEQVFPGLVSEIQAESGEANKGVKAGVLPYMLLKALQEATSRIETLETQNASLEARLTALEGGAE